MSKAIGMPLAATQQKHKKLQLFKMIQLDFEAEGELAERRYCNAANKKAAKQRLVYRCQVFSGGAGSKFFF